MHTDKPLIKNAKNNTEYEEQLVVLQHLKSET